MKTRNLKITVIVLILAGCFSSCASKMDDENKPVSDPETAILGKWELVTYTYFDGESRKFTPTGYTEFLPGGRFGWYDYKTNEYTLYEGKYWLDNHVDELGAVYWSLHYENNKIYNEKTDLSHWLYDYYDQPYGNNFSLSFINHDTMGLLSNDICLLRPVTNIYKRLK